MRKVTSSILIGLACTSILSLSTGVQSVKADAQEEIKQTQILKQSELQDANYINDIKNTIYQFKGNNLKNGNITNKTTKLAIGVSFHLESVHFQLRDSLGRLVYDFSTGDLTGQTFNIPLLKAGETYKLVASSQPGISLSHFTVVDGEKIEVPTINKVTSQDTSITGTGVAGATVNATIAGDTYTGTVDASGNYNISLNKTYAVNSAITVTQEKDGITSDAATATVVAPEQLNPPTINTVTDKATTVTGTAAAGATVHLTVNGLNFHTVASDTGEFSINIEKNYPFNTPIEVYQELNGVKSETVEVYVQLTADFIINKIKSNDTSITGTGHPNAQITVQIDDEDFTGTIDGSGNFTINLQGATFKVGTDVTITSVSSEGTETKTVKIYPQDPVIGVVFAADDEIRGTADPGATVIIIVGSTQYQTTADSAGQFRQSVNPNLVVSGALVTVHSTINGYESEKVSKTVD